MLISLLLSSLSALEISPILRGGVLQEGVPVAAWGSGAAPHASVSVSTVAAADGHALRPSVSVEATADANGNWSATLPPHRRAWAVTLVAKSGGATAQTNVSFGLVVMCAGQSNMDMPVDCHLRNRTMCYTPKLAFHADNGTAEVAASGRYTGKIWHMKAVQSKYHQPPRWLPASPATLAPISAVCWYTGKSLFERMGGDTPVGLMQASVGGSPIEYWLPPSGTVDRNACESDVPQCDNQYDDSFFFSDIVSQLVPHTFGALVWDQAERDVKCPVSTASYACMQRLLATSWREAFGSPAAAFVAVQLPGYTAALANGTGVYPGYITGEMVQAMRLQQAAGAARTPNATFVPTYDLSDPSSPYGSVHNPEKGPIGARLAAQLVKALRLVPGADEMVVQGPRATSVRAAPASAAGGPAAAPAAPVGQMVVEGRDDATPAGFEVTVAFAGGHAPFVRRGTKNCTTCCDEPARTHTLDFDARAGETGAWVNATRTTLDATTGAVRFHVALDAKPTTVRYTAASIFPQCALYNAEGLPALPFSMAVE